MGVWTIRLVVLSRLHSVPGDTFGTFPSNDKNACDSPRIVTRSGSVVPSATLRRRSVIMTSSAALRRVDRRRISLHQPVSSYNTLQ